MSFGECIVVNTLVLGQKDIRSWKSCWHVSFASGSPSKWVIEQVWQPEDENQQHPGRRRKLHVHLTPLYLFPPLPAPHQHPRGNPGPAQEGLMHRDRLVLPSGNLTCNISSYCWSTIGHTAHTRGILSKCARPAVDNSSCQWPLTSSGGFWWQWM